MGTREVYEEKLRSGNLWHEPTLKPGLGAPRCPRCLSLVNPDSAANDWAISPILRDAMAVAGCGIGGLVSGVYALNTGAPFLRSRMKGPTWVPLAIAIPTILACSAFGGYTLPRYVQLIVTSYHSSSSASHQAVSLMTRHVEQSCSSKSSQG